MSTWCTIGKTNLDGSVTTINCHHDGYLKHAGTILSLHYDDPAKVDELLALGDLCKLDITIGGCVAYNRDYDEPMVKMARNAYPDNKFEPVNHKDGLLKVYQQFDHSRSQFCYIMAQGSWIVIGGDSGNWEDLGMVLEDLEETF